MTMNTWSNCEPLGLVDVTVMAAVPLFPSLVAVTVAEPAARPVTNPAPLTGATAVSLLDQTTTVPASCVPLESFAVAVSCSVCPSCTLADRGVTETEAAAPGGGTGAVAVVLQLAVS